MKLKKMILSVLTIIILITMWLGMTSKVNAETISPPIYLGLERYRSSGYSYMAIEKVMWKISSYDNASGSNPNKNRTLYCIKAGAGFGSRDDMGQYVGENVIRPYSQKFDLKNRTSITGNYLDVLPSGSDYNSLIWVLEQCYVPENDTNHEYRKKLLNAAGIPSSKISDDEIDVAQQLAIWYFTKNDKTDYKVTARTFALAVKEKQDADYIVIDDKFNRGDQRNEDAVALFNYLVDGGLANASKTPTPNNTKNPISINTSSSKIVEEGNNYLLGPYTLNEEVNNIEYTLSYSLKNGNTDVPYTLLNSSKTATKLEDVIGSQFYIRVSKDNYASGLKFKVAAKTYETTLTYLSVVNAQATYDQPVVEIGKEEKNYELEITTPNIPEVKLFDLALRKFITKINNTTYDRVPNITNEQISKLNNGVWTVEKKHTKVPLQVETGDTVLYTIRIYNEGEVAGKATKITDYLPEGLKLKQNSTINTENGWTNPSGDGKTIETNKLSGRVLQPCNGSTIDYADVQIECEVTALSDTTGKTLKNIAEITEHKDADGNDITDRDSVPNNLSTEQKQNYNPGNSEKGWGYQDDDDYEELVMPGKYFDLALRKFITKINDKAYDRVPNITSEQLSKLNNGTSTVEKTHTKAPLQVETGDIVLYTIRIYNEGELAGKATKITDHLPEGLKLKENSTINTENGWTNPSGDGKTIETSKLDERILQAFNGSKLDYADVQIECEVTALSDTTGKTLKNVAQITEHKDAYGKNITDRDSQPNNLTQEQKQNYNPGNSEKGWGYQDDDDYEELVMPGKKFDLALRKFITKINDTEYNREPQITSEQLAKLNNGTDTVEKIHTKAPLQVETGDTVLYTIRIYNEGTLAGKATKITDHLPEGLKLKENSTINTENGWTNPSGDGKTIETDKLKERILQAFNGSKLDYADVQIECEVIALSDTTGKTLKNVAQITEHKDAYGNDITDRDSQPNNLTEEQKQNYNPGTSELGWGYQDDDDYEELVMPAKYFDLALRKFITEVDKKQENGTNIQITTKEPKVDVTPLKDGTGTTAIYKHEKSPLGVAVGNEVIYTIRIYNEGQLDGYVTEITDYLPPELEFVNDEFNAKYGWTSEGRIIKTDITSPNTKNSANRDSIYSQRTTNDDKVLLKAFNGEELDYIDVKIKCRVVNVQKLDTIITNIAEITGFTDSRGNTVIDRDSTADSLTKDNSKEQDDIKDDNLPQDIDLPDYRGRDTNKSILTDSTYHYKGQQDDDDFDKLIIQEFDLALRKFITAVNEQKVTNRYPVFTTEKDENGNYIYKHTKEPIEVETTDLVEYTIRIYNEGNVAGYAKEVKDNIPSGLEFIPTNETNKEYRWKMLDEQGNETEEVSKAKYITTDYLSKEQESEERENLISPFDQETMGAPSYKDVKVVFKVIAPSKYEGIITNIAEISDDSDENGNPIIDKDSEPNNDDEKEDDIDVEHIKLSYFDLALRKFITAVNEKEVSDRYPVFSIDKEGNYIYTHTKEPVEVENGNIVTYTLRIYNEGTKAGYATEIMDDIPEGLKFVPDNEENVKYNWIMYRKVEENEEIDEVMDFDGVKYVETNDANKADIIVTDYLSRGAEHANR